MIHLPPKRRAEACGLGSVLSGVRGVRPPLGSEADFEEGLSLPRTVVLTDRPAVDYSEVGAIHVVGAPGVGVTDLHPIEDIIEFHPQFSGYAFGEVEVLCQCKVLKVIERPTQTADPARRIAHSEASR